LPVAASAAALLTLASPLQAQDANSELAAKATDPTASLMSFQLNDWYTARFHGVDDSANQVVLRAAIPFTLAGMNHILRITQGYATSTPSDATGLVDTGIFDLITFNLDWGRWGAGISATLPTGAGFRQLVGQDAELGPVRAELLFLCGQRQRARRAAAQPAADPELSARRRALDLAGQ
jgi:hypothetical protein